MPKKTEKKTRGPNFSSEEKDILIHLITKYKDLVENKRTDATTTKLKNEAWANISEEFNSLSSFSTRNTDQLKTCWDNIKRNRSKDNALLMKKLSRTEGGRPYLPPTESYQGHVEVEVKKEIVLDSDSDNTPISLECEIEVTENSNIIGTVFPQDDVNFNQENESSVSSMSSNFKEDKCLMKSQEERKMWNGCSQAALQTKVSENLAKQKDTQSWLHRRRPKTSLHHRLLQNKIELVELMKRNTESEAQLKNLILEEQLKQEKLKTLALELKLKAPDEKE